MLKNPSPNSLRFHFPSEIISPVVWRYPRFYLRFREVEEVLTEHGLTQNLFRVGRHLVKVVHYRLLRAQVFQVWKKVACA